MSLYNLMNGVTKATFFILPMLDKHPDEYPRFRDCFTSDEERPDLDNLIHVYTRVGGGNRGEFGEEWMYDHPNFVTTFDDSFDNTFGTYVFSVPEEWKADFDKILAGKLKEISPEYQAQLRKVYPKLEEQFNKIFS